MDKDDEIFRAALSLPGEARAELADRLLESLDESDQDEIDARWTREAEGRIAAFERGEISAIPGDEVFTSLKFRRSA
jgi:putative addiction module component (TIGR02574 family)